MKKYKSGDIVKTKNGDKCIIVDIMDDDAMIFNLSKMEPDTIKINEIEKTVGKANCTTMIVNGKKVKSEDEEEKTEYVDEKEKEKDDDDINERFGELIKIFGQAAIALGNIFVKMSQEDENEE